MALPLWFRAASIRPRKKRRSFLSAADTGWIALSNFVAASRVACFH